MSGFSDISVWRQTTVSGFKQQAFIMFHGTNPDAASSIVRENRFRISTGPDTMLGNGVYVSVSRAKAQAYGEVIFKLLVYPGDVCRVDRQGHPWQRKWQRCYDSAWVPQNCGMVLSGLEENCIKSESQIRILGVCKGFRYLDQDAQDLERNLCSSSDSALGDDEMEDIYDFLVKNGLLYSKLYNRTNGTFLAASNYSYEVEAVSNKNCYGKRMYWTRSYDGCIENLLTGEVIALDDDQQNICLEHPNPEDEWQKWKINTKTGVILNRVTKTPLSSFSNGAPCLESNYLGRDCFQFIKPKESYTKFLSANYCSV